MEILIGATYLTKPHILGLATDVGVDRSTTEGATVSLRDLGYESSSNWPTHLQNRAVIYLEECQLELPCGADSHALAVIWARDFT